MASFTWFLGNTVVRERGVCVRGVCKPWKQGLGNQQGAKGGREFTVALLGRSAHTRSLDT